MKQSSKTTKISLKKIRGANKATPYARVKEALSWRERSLNKTQYEEMYTDLYKWALKSTSISITAFCNEWGMRRDTFYSHVKKSKDLAYVHGLVKEIIGSRLQKLAMYRKNECNEKTIHRTLHLYNPDWKEVFDAEVDLKKEISRDDTNNKPTNITVVMEKIEPEEDKSR